MKLAPRLSDVGTLAYKACCERRASPTISRLPNCLSIVPNIQDSHIYNDMLFRDAAGDMVVGTEMLSTLLATHPMPDAAR